MLTVPVVGYTKFVLTAAGRVNVKLADGKVIVVESVPANVNEFEAVKVFDVVPPAIENPVAFDVKESPL